jgi:hypothetical protein
MARELECDESDAEFDKKLKEIATQKPADKSPKVNRK